MRKILILCLALVMLFVVTACVDEATIRVRNNTNGTVWFEIDDGELMSLSSSSNWSRTYSSDRYVKVDYTGDHVFTGTRYLDLQLGKTVTLDIYADGGAIKIVNNSSVTIYSVFISPSSSSSWGVDQLGSELLYPNNTKLWTVSQNTWDIKVVDTYGESYYVWDKYVPMDTTVQLNFTDAKKGDAKAKTDGVDPAFNVSYKVEAR